MGVSRETIRKQEEALTEITNGVMGDVVDKSMEQTTDLKAQLTDEVFHNLAVRVEMMGDYAHKLFADPSAVGRVEGTRLRIRIRTARSCARRSWRMTWMRRRLRTGSDLRLICPI